MKHLKTYENFEYEEVYLYHGTSYDNAMNIYEEGFSEDTYWGSRSNAEDYAYSYDDSVLIKAPKSEILSLAEPNYTLINHYEEGEEDEDNKESLDEWNESNKTTEDSLNIFDSVILPPTGYSIEKEDIERI